MGDCHLGGWRQPELRELNLESFKYAINTCISEKVDFVLITGDFFDNPYPPIEILKEAFSELKRLKDVNIPVFYISGSHDYSASGKTFLDVLEKAGFCRSVMNYETKSDSIVLLPTIYKNVAIYGYPGKKSSMEVEEIEKVTLQDCPGLFKILMLHTAIRDAIGNIPINAVDHRNLPKTDYLALSHLHIKYSKEGRVYSGPIFPNNISELEELGAGSFYIFDNGMIRRLEIRPKEIKIFNIEITDALSATENIISLLDKEFLRDKIVILKLFGTINKGKTSDIDFIKIENFAKSKGVYSVLRSISRLFMSEQDIKLESLDGANLEENIIDSYIQKNPGKYNYLIPELLKSLQVEKLDDEKSSVFEERVISDSIKVLNIK